MHTPGWGPMEFRRGLTATCWAPTDPGVPLLLDSSGVPGEEEEGPGWLFWAFLPSVGGTHACHAVCWAQ